MRDEGTKKRTRSKIINIVEINKRDGAIIISPLRRGSFVFQREGTTTAEKWRQLINDKIRKIRRRSKDNEPVVGSTALIYKAQGAAPRRIWRQELELDASKSPFG